MPDMFRKAVHEALSAGMRGQTHPMRGVIPQDGIDSNDWTCTVHVPNPKSGSQPISTASGRTNFLVLQDVPLPHNADGVIQAILNLVNKGPRAVTVGFKGANLSFPYIINFESFVHEVTDKPDKATPGRTPATPQKFTTVAAPGVPGTAARSFIGPPAPLIGPPVPPSIAGGVKASGKSAEASAATGAAFRDLLNRSTDVKVGF